MKKQMIFLLLFNYLMIFCGCSSFKKELIPTYNKGGYTINIVKNKMNSDEVTIKGTVFDIKTGKAISPPVLMTVGCRKIQTSSQGEYSFKTPNVKRDYFFIKVISIGYKTIETSFIDLYNKNEVKIDFYLVEDDIPFIDCPPDANFNN